MTANGSTTRVVSDSGDDIGPGQRLREAREAAQLSLAEVASRMRLEPQIVELLEGDHYERLHGPTFVRGYLSGYARLLDLPERPILEAYERHDYRPPALVSELGRKPEVRVSDFPVRMVTYVIAGLLVVLVVLWWQSRQLNTDTPERAAAPADSMPQTTESSASSGAPSDTPWAATGSSASTQSAVAVETAQPAQAPAETASEAGEQQLQAAMIEAPTLGVESAPTETPPGEDAPPGESTTQAQAGPASASAPAAMALQATDEPAGADALEPAGEAGEPTTPQPVAVARAVGDSAEGGDTSTASGVEQEAAPAPLPAPLPGSDRLAIQLARESWVEIYDRGGGRLYYNLAGEGSEVIVQGAGPMRVLLGDIEGAAVAYNGEPFDLSRYRGRSVVRFTVGELSGTTPPQSPAPATSEEPLTRKTPQPSTGRQEQSVAGAATALIPPAPTAGPVPRSALPARTQTPPETPLGGKQPDS